MFDATNTVLIKALSGYTIPEPIIIPNGLNVKFQPDTNWGIPANYGPGRWQATFTVVDSTTVTTTPIQTTTVPSVTTTSTSVPTSTTTSAQTTTSPSTTTTSTSAPTGPLPTCGAMGKFPFQMNLSARFKNQIHLANRFYFYDST